ncbi:MAG TPA: ferredoxin family protein [Rubneribacter badeniensis]|uniref:Ferredoxin family protein n=1 Tax=Rubneribacter badeniensis TaxID=2070688 RepID=A0A9D2VI89_9ACTN|nr:ferredoxin family protein [Rubneribacter badeniensis]
MSYPAINVNVDAKLATNKYNVDEGHAHIELVDEADRTEFRKLVLACPAALYKFDEDGDMAFDYAGCLECGTCRILCGSTILKRWEYPQPTMGVEYRYG